MAEISRDQYWDEISSIAKDITDEAREAIKAGDINPDRANEFASERIHEWIDGHQWVIYPANNMPVLQHSNNDEAMFEEGMTPSNPESWSDLTSVGAYMAMERDVVGHSGWGVDDLEDEFEEDEDEDDEEDDED